LDVVLCLCPVWPSDCDSPDLCLPRS
jgi:hypothetical protein